MQSGMKKLPLLVFVCLMGHIVRVHSFSVPLSSGSRTFHRQIYREIREPGHLLRLLHTRQIQAQLNFLTELVAREWGYSNSSIYCNSSRYMTPTRYLENVANRVLSELKLTLRQRINGIIIRSVMKAFDRSISLTEFERKLQEARIEIIEQGEDLLKNEMYDHISLARKVHDMALTGNELAMDSMLESFTVSINLKAHHEVVDHLAMGTRRNIGVYALVNEFLDHSFRLALNKSYLLEIPPRKLQELLEEKIRANYNTKVEESVASMSDLTVEITETTEYNIHSLVPESSTNNDSHTNIPIQSNIEQLDNRPPVHSGIQSDMYTGTDKSWYRDNNGVKGY